MQDVYSFVSFTTEIMDDKESRYIPKLGFQMMMRSDNTITYKYYEKEIGSHFMIMVKSAVSDNTKRSTLAQETIRRMVNTSEEESIETRTLILDKFNSKMENSGYCYNQRR